MLIEIERLAPEPMEFHHEYGVDELPFEHNDAVLGKPVSSDFVLTHKDRDLHIIGTVRTEIRFQCARCLREVVLPLAASFDLLYSPQPEGRQEEEIELKYEDMEVAFYDGESLDVDLMTLEQIELALPMKFICDEGCKGLCPNCGADLNQGACACKLDTSDTRLAVLREFRSKMKQ